MKHSGGAARTHRHCWLDGTGVCLECGLSRSEASRSAGMERFRVDIAAEARREALALAREAVAGLRRPAEGPTAKSYVDMTRGGAFDDALRSIDALLEAPASEVQDRDAAERLGRALG